MSSMSFNPRERKLDKKKHIYSTVSFFAFFVLVVMIAILCRPKYQEFASSSSEEVSISEVIKQPHFFDSYIRTSSFPTSEINEFLANDFDDPVNEYVPSLEGTIYYYKVQNMASSRANFQVFVIFESDDILRLRLTNYRPLLEETFTLIQIYSLDPYYAQFIDKAERYFLHVGHYKGLEAYHIVRLDIEQIP